MQPAGCARETAALRDGDEGAQLAELDPAAIP
jgi:hypothetical protein